jgi:UDP-glucose:glycoprotein glucosyltransferase
MRSLKALLLVHVVSSQLPFSASASSLWTSWLKSDEGNSVKDASQQEDDLQLVSPIINRELQARVVAHAWPTTVHSVVCEAMIYFDSSPLFLQRLATQLLLQKEDEDEEDDSSEPLSYEQATKHILQASLLNQTALLELHLAMRAASPHCEMHRTVARQLLLESHPHLDATSMSQINVVMAIVQQPNKVQQVLVGEAAIQSFDYDSSSSFIAGASSYSEADISTTLLHGEHLYRKDTPSKTVLIVYANLGSKEFARVYQYLLQSTSLPFVVRHLGAVYFEDLPESTAATNPSIQHTALQGYGVRLDIRNVEYKVFDYRVEHKDDGESSLRALVNLSDAQLTMPVDFLAGVNASALNIVDTDMNTLQAKLWKQHEQQQRTSQIVPPAWQRRQLPLQMTTVISKHSKNDPLLALEELSQNLPSVASTLVHVKIDEGVLEMATKLDEINTLKSGKLYVNGRVIHFDRPSFNVFELLDIMKEEEAALHQMQQQLGAYLTMEELTLLQDAWIMGDAFLKGATTDDASDVAATTTKDVDTVYRVDVARGGKLAVLYLNDVEKDRAYQQWPRSVKKMLMNMQYGYVYYEHVVSHSLSETHLTMLLFSLPYQYASHGSPQLVHRLGRHGSSQQNGQCWS